MINAKKIALLFPVVVVVFTTIMAPQRALAQTPTYAPQCGGGSSELNSWDWPQAVEKGLRQDGTESGAKITDFDYQNDSYVIFKRPANQFDPYKRNVYEIVRAAKEKNRITIKKGTLNAVTGKYNATLDTVGQSMQRATMSSESDEYLTNNNALNFRVDSSYKNSNFHANVSSSSASPYTMIVSTNGTDENPGSNVLCIVGGHNVNYDPNWDFAQLERNIDYGVNPGQKCGAIEVGCWVGKIFRGIANTFEAFGMALVEAFVNIFAPDSNEVKADFDNFASFMQEKLGFLVYPIVFISDVFNAFTSGTAWCSATACTKDFGNLFGRPFNLDLRQLQVTMPTVWTWFTAMIRGLTILGLLIAVRKKYMGVVHQ